MYNVCSIYIELSEKYRKIDPASNASKRKALAMHLKESVDCLEEKVRFKLPVLFGLIIDVVGRSVGQADEIKGLYDLLYTQENTARRRFDQRCPA